MLFHTLVGLVVRQLTTLSSAGLNSSKIAGILNPEIPVYKFIKYIIFLFS
jgi:hypothetical protein